MTGSEAPSAGVFISYRRQETAPYARMLREELRRHLDAEQVFMDVDSIDVGVDFVEAIQHAVGRCAVLLALVGPRWLAATDAAGRRQCLRQLLTTGAWPRRGPSSSAVD